MSRESLCKLCIQKQAVELDLETSRLKSVNKLLQRLFESYNIDISILGEKSCICDSCFEDLVHLSNSLEKWSKAQRDLEEAPLEIDDSQLFQVKQEPPSSDNEMAVDSPQISDIKTDFLPESNEIPTPTPPTTQPNNLEPLNSTPTNSFAAGIGRNGLVLVKLLKDKTKVVKILCTCCHQLFDYLHQVRLHSSVPRTNPEYMCRECGASFPSAGACKEHRSKAKGHSLPDTDYRLRREIEFWSFAREKRYQRYSDIIRTETSPSHPVRIRCHKCPMIFKCRKAYEEHALGHSFKGPKIIKKRLQTWPQFQSGKMHDVSSKANVSKFQEAGQFISLPMKLTLQPGKYISLNSKMKLNSPNLKKV